MSEEIEVNHLHVSEDMNKQIVDSIPDKSEVSISQEHGKFLNSRKDRKCKDFSKMSYWEGVTTSSLL